MEKSNTTDLILKAAMEEFLEKGFDGARMQAIADRAGINKALLHYHHKTKENLYMKVFKSIFQEFFASILTKISPDLSVMDYLKAFIENYIDNVASRKHMLKFIIWELENDGKNIGNMVREISPVTNPASNFPIFHKLEEAKAQGIIRNVDVPHLILNIISMCLYPFIAQKIVANIWSNDNINNPTFLEERKKEIFNLIWFGIAKENK